MIRYTIIILLTAAFSVFSDTSAFSGLSAGDIETSMFNTTGVAFSDSLILKNHNYSSWAGAANTSFSMSVSYYEYDLKDISGNKSAYDRFTFEDISFALPFGNRNFFGISYYPVSLTDISNVSEENIEVEESFEDTYLRTLENKVGSISNISFIYGKAFNDLSLNINSSLKLGNYDSKRRYEYSSYFQGTETIDWEKYFENKEKTQLFHVCLGTGFLYKSKFGFDLGATISVPVFSKGQKLYEFDKTTSYGTVIEEITDSLHTIDAEWPFEFSAGISSSISHYTFSYDFITKLYDGLDLGIDNRPLNNYYRNVFGLSFQPGKRKYDPYYQRMRYSVFFTAETRPYKLNDETITDLTGTFGINFPFNNNRSGIELRFGYTESGSLNKNGIEYDSFKIQIIFNSSDRWWLKKEKYDD